MRYLSLLLSIIKSLGYGSQLFESFTGATLSQVGHVIGHRRLQK